MIVSEECNRSEISKSNRSLAIRNAIIFGIALWVLCFLLANLEVQIEGPNGWAAQLPTWRSLDPRITWIFGGRPVTGYHVYLNLLLLSFFHFPFLFTKFSWDKEARLVSAYALMAVVWDFLWFVINPSFGIDKYSAPNIWWFKHWALGFPADYYVGILFSLLIMIGPGLIRKRGVATATLIWIAQFLVIAGLSGLMTLVY